MKRYFLFSGVEIDLEGAKLFSACGVPVRWMDDGLPSAADLDAVMKDQQARELTA